MSDQASGPRAGWYDDPAVGGQQRWWDGAGWTPATRPLTDVTRVAPVAGAPVEGPEPSPGMSRSAKVVLAVVGLLAFVGGCSAVAASRSAGTGDAEADGVVLAPGDGEADGVVLAPGDASPGEPAPETESVPESDATPEAESEGEPADRAGTRADPLPYDHPVEVRWTALGDADGSVWTTVIGRPRDITDEVRAAALIDRRPPRGRRLVAFDVELTLVEASKEPLAPAFNIRWEIVGGSTNRTYDPGLLACGPVPGQLDVFDQAYVGGTLAGTICVRLPEEDVDHPDTRVALRYIDDGRTFFG